METIDANQQPLGVPLFIKAYRAARKIAPARFLTIRIHPELFAQFNREHAELTEVVQVGSFTGHLGKPVTKIACVPAANGLGDGVIVKEDLQMSTSRLEFQLHGVTELEIINLRP